MSSLTRCPPPCGCYIADHLRRCPKCSKKVKRKTKEEDKAEEHAEELARIAKLNGSAKVLDAHKLKWMPPKAARIAKRAKLEELRSRLKKGDKSVRAELHLLKADIAGFKKGRWSWEYPPPKYNEKGEVVVTRGQRVAILISPKGNRYVRATGNEQSHLVLDYGEKDLRGWWYPGGGYQVRLRRYEKSTVAKQSKKQEQDLKARALAKKERKKRRKEKQKLKKRMAVQ